LVTKIAPCSLSILCARKLRLLGKQKHNHPPCGGMASLLKKWTRSLLGWPHEPVTTLFFTAPPSHTRGSHTTPCQAHACNDVLCVRPLPTHAMQELHLVSDQSFASVCSEQLGTHQCDLASWDVRKSASPQPRRASLPPWPCPSTPAWLSLLRDLVSVCSFIPKSESHDLVDYLV